MPYKMGQGHTKLYEQGSKLFTQRQSLHQFWQEVAYQFYTEMADFTYKRYLGDEFSDHLTTSYPLIARRTLGDTFSAFMRPTNLDNSSPGVWFNIAADDENREDTEAKRWLEWATGVQRRAMYDQTSGFVRATKEGDHSFVSFGQCPLSVGLNSRRDGLLYRCWHLRDVAWTEDSEGQIDAVWRKWKPQATQLADAFGDKVAPELKTQLENDPYGTVECCHIVVKTENYERRGLQGKKFRQPWISIWIDKQHNYVMEEIGSFSRKYVIPRWVTIPGSQYASSPAVTAALPDARLIQAMSLTILEAGEKYADPPIIATQEAIRSDIALFAGGTTYIDAEYDERLGDAIRPLYEGNAGNALTVALELRADVRDMIARAFFLDSLQLPPADVSDMTAFEVSQRISEWIRRAMPIFEPVQFDYNGALCEETFDLLMRNGAFGSLDDLPQSLRGADVGFKFESPLHESVERKKGQKFLEAKEALMQAAELDPSVAPMLNASAALRDVLTGIGTPADWIATEAEFEDIQQRQQEADAQQAEVEGGAAGASVAKDLAAASKDFAASASEGAPAVPAQGAA